MCHFGRDLNVHGSSWVRRYREDVRTDSCRLRLLYHSPPPPFSTHTTTNTTTTRRRVALWLREIGADSWLLGCAVAQFLDSGGDATFGILMDTNLVSAFAEEETLPDPECTTNPDVLCLFAVARAAKDSALWTTPSGHRHSLTDGIVRAEVVMIGGKQEEFVRDVGKSCAFALHGSGTREFMLEGYPICAVQSCMKRFQMVSMRSISSSPQRVSSTSSP